MDRASDSGSEGWGFESLPVYQTKKRIPERVSSSSFLAARGKGLEDLNATVRRTVAADGSTEANIYLLPKGSRCKRVPSGVCGNKGAYLGGK